MTDLSIRYLGLELEHPLIMGASPLIDDLDMVKRLEDAGAAAIVMHSLFEEQIGADQQALQKLVHRHTEASPEAQSYLPKHGQFALGPDEYLEQIRKIKAAVRIPVIGSLNGVTNSGWLDYGRLIEQAGADALELNVYQLVTDPSLGASSVEAETLEMLGFLRRETKLPIAIKLSPFYTALPHFARQLQSMGADALVIFNRFYQPDINIEELEVESRLVLSESSELLLRLRWLAILSAQLELSLGVTGGVHNAHDAIQALMAGAHGVQIVSEILRHGPARFTDIKREMKQWLEQHEYDSVAQMRGNMNLGRCPFPGAYERANYMRILQQWRAL